MGTHEYERGKVDVVPRLLFRSSIVIEDLDCAIEVQCKNMQAIVRVPFDAEEPRKQGSKSRSRDKNAKVVELRLAIASIKELCIFLISYQIITLSA